MNPRDVFNARANYENAAKTGTQRSMEFLKIIENRLKQHADELQVAQESNLNSVEDADEKGWVKTSYQVYNVTVPVTVRSLGQRVFEVSVNEDSRVRIDEASADDLLKVCGLIFGVALHHYDRARNLLTS
jgi:hypothetical protein